MRHRDRPPSLARALAASLLVAGAVAFGATPVVAADPVPAGVTLHRSGAPIGGEAFTFTPVFTPAFPDGFLFPASTVCSWELRWGDTASIVHNQYDATFGSLLVRGKGSDGFCDPWTFTLPHSAAGLWQFHFTYDDELGTYVDTPYTTMSGTNAPGAAGIAESNLPGVWLSMPGGTHQGDMVTATAHPFGGYVLPPDGAHWDAYGACDCQPFASATNHALTFTFRASVPGTVTVFYNDTGTPETGGPNFAGAGIDPKVIDVRVTSSVPSTMHRATRYAVSATGKGFVGAVTYAWYVNGQLRTTGRTAHLRFTGTGWRTIKVVARDGHGHRASHSVRRYIHR